MRTTLLFAPALLLLASASPAQPAAQTISLYSYGFKPGPIALQAGRPVTLKFVNTSTKGHDFTAPEFFRASRIVSGNVTKGEVASFRRRIGRPLHWSRQPVSIAPTAAARFTPCSE